VPATCGSFFFTGCAHVSLNVNKDSIIKALYFGKECEYYSIYSLYLGIINIV
jgi:hypothetical protein